MLKRFINLVLMQDTTYGQNGLNKEASSTSMGTKEINTGVLLSMHLLILYLVRRLFKQDNHQYDICFVYQLNCMYRRSRMFKLPCQYFPDKHRADILSDISP